MPFDTSAAAPEELGALDLLAPLQRAAAGLPGEAPDPKKHPKDSSTDVISLRVTTLDIAATDLVAQLATAFITYSETAKRLTDEVILAPPGADPYRCARLQLLDITTSRRGELDVRGGNGSWDPKEAKLGEWESGRFLGLDRKRGDGETENLWVTALPNGDVVLTASGAVTSEKVRWKKLRAYARGEERSFKDGPGATLLDAAAVRALADAGKAGEIGDLVLNLFRAFLGG